MMDGYLGALDEMGCVIALTADHGMNAKTWMDGHARRDLPAGPSGRLAGRRARRA
jgi:hypothetical protein